MTFTSSKRNPDQRLGSSEPATDDNDDDSNSNMIQTVQINTNFNAIY